MGRHKENPKKSRKSAVARVEIAGFGPVTVRGLSKGRVKQIRRLDTPGEQCAEIVKRGLVEPEFTVEVATELGNRIDVLLAVEAAILERSWPEVEA